jgi:hypothetical protein
LTIEQPAACREGGGRVANQRATCENFSDREKPAPTQNQALTVSTSMPEDPEKSQPPVGNPGGLPTGNDYYRYY